MRIDSAGDQAGDSPAQQIQIICKFKELPAAQVTWAHFSFGQDLKLGVFLHVFHFQQRVL